MQPKCLGNQIYIHENSFNRSPSQTIGLTEVFLTGSSYASYQNISPYHVIYLAVMHMPRIPLYPTERHNRHIKICIFVTPTSLFFAVLLSNLLITIIKMIVIWHCKYFAKWALRLGWGSIMERP